MNAAHLHLLVNHLPIFATLLAIPIALYALVFSEQAHVLRVSAFLLAVAAAGSVVSMRSGEDAEDIVEPMDGVESTQLHAHSDDAHTAAPISVAAAALALFVLALDHKTRGRKRKLWTLALLVAAMAAGIALGRTGMSGGVIQHREIREGFDPNAPVTDAQPLDL